jgi:RNA polymerase sigma-70 factor (ECF subfamily)
MEPPPDERADESVWRDALAGSPEAWGELFLRHGKALYAYCYRRTGEQGAAEDLTSAVFLEAWKLRGRAQAGGAAALPWLYGIATMLTRNHHRSLRRHSAALERMGRAETSSQPDPAPEVAARIDAQRELQHIRALLATLPRNDRDVLELAAMDTLSIAEIAAALNVPVGTAKSRLSRARRRLNDLLAHCGDEAPHPARQPGRTLHEEARP